MLTKKRVLVLAVVLTAVVSSSTLAQNDFEDCDLIGSPDLQLLLGAGGQMLFRDEDLVNDNECVTIPANDYEFYVDGVVQAPNFFHYQSRAAVDPGSDFEINFNYRPYLNNNSHFQMLINTNSENVGAVGDGLHMNNPRLGPLPTGALRIRLGDASRIGGFDGLIWEVVGSGNSGGVINTFNYEALVNNTEVFERSEVNLNIKVTDGQFLTVEKQIFRDSFPFTGAPTPLDATPVTVLNNVDIGTGMSTATGNFITFTTLESAAQIDDFAFTDLSTGTDDPDFDNDGDADGGDFILWQRKHGLMGTALNTDGDANGDMNVDGIDLAAWIDRYGDTGIPTVQGISSVPEPSALAIGLVAIGTLIATRRR